MTENTEEIIKDGKKYHFEWDKSTGSISITECCLNDHSQDDDEDDECDCQLETYDFITQNEEMEYDEGNLQTDIDWMTNNQIDESEAEQFIKGLLKHKWRGDD